MPNRAALWRAKVEAEAGVPCPVVERHRHGLTFAMPDGSRRLIRSLRAHHTHDNREIDTDLDDDTGGFVARSRTLDYDIRFTATAGRRITPRPEIPGEHIEVGRPQRFTGNQWRNYIPTSLYRSGHQIVFRSAVAGDVHLSVLPDRVATETVLADSAQNLPWRWPFTLVGLSWQGNDLEGWRLVSTTDGQTVLWMGVPRWHDSGKISTQKSGLISWTRDATYITYQPPDLTGALFPVTLDPDFSTQIGASLDDGWATDAALNATATYLGVGQSAVSQPYRTWLCFLDITIDDGSTIDAAHIHLRTTTDSLPGDAKTRIYVVDEDTHVPPTTRAEWVTDHGSHTSAYTEWDFTISDTNDTEQITSDFATPFQEWIDRVGYASGADLGVHIDDDGSAAGDIQAWASWDNTSYAAPDLDVTYTPLGVDDHTHPSPLATVATFGTVTLKAGSATSPAALATVATFPAPTMQTGWKVAVVALATAATFGTVSLAAGSATSPASLATQVAFPTAEVSGAGSIQPNPLATVAAFPAPTLQTGWATTVSPLGTQATFGAPTVNAGTTTSPDPLGTQAAFPTPTLAAGTTTSPNPLGTAATFGEPTTGAGISVSPAPLTTVASILEVTTSPNATTSPQPLATQATFPAAEARSSFAVAANPLTTSSTFPNPTSAAGWAAEPDPLGTVSAFPTPTVQAAQQTTPNPLSTQAAFPTPSTAAGTGSQPAPLGTVSAFPGPTFGVGWAVEPAPLTTVAAFPAAGLAAGATTSPNPLGTQATFPGPAFNAGTTITVNPLGTQATFPGPSFGVGWAVQPDPLQTSSVFPAAETHAGTQTLPGTLRTAAAFPTPTFAAGVSFTPNPLRTVSTFGVATVRVWLQRQQVIVGADRASHVDSTEQAVVDA